MCATVDFTCACGTVDTSVPFGAGTFPSGAVTLSVTGALIDTSDHIAVVARKPGEARARPVDTHPLSLHSVTVMLAGFDMTFVSGPSTVADTFRCGELIAAFQTLAVDTRALLCLTSGAAVPNITFAFPFNALPVLVTVSNASRQLTRSPAT